MEKLVNGIYIYGGFRCGEADRGFTIGNAYVFTNGYTQDDNGDKRPAVAGLSSTNHEYYYNQFFKDQIFIKLNLREDTPECVSNGKMPQNLMQYIRRDVEATAEILETFGKAYMIRHFPKVGDIVRDKHTLTAYCITNIKQCLVNGEPEHGIWFRSLNTGLASNISVDYIYLFWDNFELFDPEVDGWGGKMFSNRPLHDSYSRVLLLKNTVTAVTKGLVSKDCDIYIKSPAELEKALGNGIELNVIQGECVFMPDAFFSYSGKAFCKKTDFDKNFTMGWVYTFANGSTVNNCGQKAYFTEEDFDAYFVKVDTI